MGLDRCTVNDPATLSDPMCDLCTKSKGAL